MNNVKNIKNSIGKKVVICWVISAAVIILGLAWFGFGWTPLGLPTWVGAALAIAAAVIAMLHTFKFEVKQKDLTTSAEASDSQPESEVEVKEEIKKVDSSEVSKPENPTPANEEKPVNKMTRAYINRTQEEADDALVEAEDVMSAAEALEDEAKKLKAEYEAKLARAKARRAAKITN